MEQKLIRFLNKHKIVLQHKRILVAVSGGPDSVALLHVLNKWRYERQLTIYAITINHQLREGAQEDVEYVRQLCRQWDISFLSEIIDVSAYQKRYGLSTQVAARQLRYDAFSRIVEEKNIDYLMLGHHGDDQVETLVMSLMRTTTLQGLTGIPFRRPFQQGNIIRPLLAVTREEIEHYCKQYDLTPRFDPSNEDTSYTRNYVRQLIVPKMKEKNNNLTTTAQQLSETLLEDEAYLQREAQAIYHKIVKRRADVKKATVKIAEISEYARPLQRRIYRLILDYLYEQLPPQLSYSHEEIFLSLLYGEAENKQLHFPEQLIVEVVYGYIECYFKTEKDKAFIEEVYEVPAKVTLPDGKILEITYEQSNDKKNENDEYVCLASQVVFPLQIRTRKPGDRMRYSGLNGSKKIKDIFIDEKIPPKKREEIIVVADAEGEILWLIGVRKGVLTKKPKDKTLFLSFTYKD